LELGLCKFQRSASSKRRNCYYCTVAIGSSSTWSCWRHQRFTSYNQLREKFVTTIKSFSFICLTLSQSGV